MVGRGGTGTGVVTVRADSRTIDVEGHWCRNIEVPCSLDVSYIASVFFSSILNGLLSVYFIVETFMK